MLNLWPLSLIIKLVFFHQWFPFINLTVSFPPTRLPQSAERSPRPATSVTRASGGFTWWREFARRVSTSTGSVSAVRPAAARCVRGDTPSIPSVVRTPVRIPEMVSVLGVGCCLQWRSQNCFLVVFRVRRSLTGGTWSDYMTAVTLNPHVFSNSFQYDLLTIDL